MQRGKSDLAVTIVHVSDTQFGAYHRFSDDDSLAANLIRDLRDLIEHRGVPRPDLIVLSGDITERAKRAEFEEARAFLDALCAELGLGPERVVVVPGNHDINWGHSRSVFAEWEADHDGEPPKPWARKWQNYREFVASLHGDTAFTENQPYRVQQFDELRLTVAALNSTIGESHRDGDHYGWCSDPQLRWFADQLPADPARASDGVLRIGVVHHNARRRAVADNENLRDEDRLTEILGDRLDLLLHGHTHEGKADRLADGTLVLATGSAAVSKDWRPDEVGNQYQVLHIEPGQVTRWARRWDVPRRRWIADTGVSPTGNDAQVAIRLEIPGWPKRDDHPQDRDSPARRNRVDSATVSRTEVSGSQGFQIGSGNVQFNHWIPTAPRAPLDPKMLGVLRAGAVAEQVRGMERLDVAHLFTTASPTDVRDVLRVLAAGDDADRELTVSILDLIKESVRDALIGPLLGEYPWLQPEPNPAATPTGRTVNRPVGLLHEPANDTVIVAGQSGWPEYEKTCAYICLPGQGFWEKVTHLGFFDRGKIKPVIPRVRAWYGEVHLTTEEAAARRAAGEPRLAAAIEYFLRSGIKYFLHSGGRDEDYGIVLLSPPDAPDTVRLKAPIVGDLFAESGKPVGGTQRYCYVSLGGLTGGATRTSEL